MRLIHENLAIPSVVFSGEVCGGSAARREKIAGTIGHHLAQIERGVRDGQETGRSRPELRFRTITVIILGIIQPATILAHWSGDGFDLIRHGREAWKMLPAAIETH